VTQIYKDDVENLMNIGENFTFKYRATFKKQQFLPWNDFSHARQKCDSVKHDFLCYINILTYLLTSK